MKTNNPLITFCLLMTLIFASCAKRVDKLPVVEVNDIEIPDIDPELLMSKNAKLSQIAEHFHIVTLETTPDCMLSADVTFQVGEEYIIALERNGIYQFSINGSFIRKLVNTGRSPEEVSAVGEVCLVEPEDMLMVISKDYNIHYYSLSTGKFLKSKGRPGIQPQETLRKCIYLGDSKILYAYSLNGLANPDMFGCGVRIEKLNGEILWQHEFNYNSIHIYSPDFKYRTGSRIFILTTGIKDEYILQVEDQDTVYKLNTAYYTIRPDLLRRIEKVQVDGYPVCLFVDNCTVETDEYARVNGYQLMTYVYVNEAKYDDSSAWTGDRYYIVYDDNKKEAHRIDIFENDYLGFFHETKGDDRSYHNFPVLLNPNGKLVERYDAFPFLKFATEALENPDLDPIVRTRLLDITGKVTETSNPILLIGDMKKKIDM